MSCQDFPPNKTGIRVVLSWCQASGGGGIGVHASVLS